MAIPKPVAWAPQPGSQVQLLSCPLYEAMIGGSRGGGKTLCVLMDYAQHVGRGFGPDWRGILFRRTYPQLSDVIQKTKAWYPRIFPDADYNKADFTWTFSDGEQLLLRHLKSADDFENYQGHAFTWIAFEELTNWPDLEGYEQMMSCLRSGNPDVPRKIRATANPLGIGHNAVKARFIDPAPPLTPIYDPQGRARVFIPSSIYENRVLTSADPGYLKTLEAITDPNRRAAWLHGSWDITAGGVFDDLWSSEVHIVRPFDIPRGWYIDRSFDWGSSKPFSVLWFAEANGEDVRRKDGSIVQVPKGTLFVIAEWYGCGDTPNKGLEMISSKIAEGIKEREAAMIASGLIYREPIPGPADSSIFTKVDEQSIADRMEDTGVFWEPSIKGPGSRVNGWAEIRVLLAASLEAPMEDRGLFVFDTCRSLIQHLPALPRDSKNRDDVDTESEDHDGDALRYRVMARRHVTETIDAPW